MEHHHAKSIILLQIVESKSFTKRYLDSSKNTECIDSLDWAVFFFGRIDVTSHSLYVTKMCIQIDPNPSTASTTYTLERDL